MGGAKRAGAGLPLPTRRVPPISCCIFPINGDVTFQSKSQNLIVLVKIAFHSRDAGMAQITPGALGDPKSLRSPDPSQMLLRFLADAFSMP